MCIRIQRASPLLRAAGLSIGLGALAVAAEACATTPAPGSSNERLQALTELSDLMVAQEEAADPAFKRIERGGAFDDQDYALFADAAERLRVTAPRLKEKVFSKGPEFDALADTLAAKSAEILRAASAKDAPSALAALAAARDTCEGCHRQFM